MNCIDGKHSAECVLVTLKKITELTVYLLELYEALKLQVCYLLYQRSLEDS